MHASTRHELLNKMIELADFANQPTNQKRVEYFLQNLMSWEQICDVIRVNVNQAKQKNGKNLSVAKNHKSTANLIMFQASMKKPKDRVDFLQKALVYYTKAILFMPHHPNLELLAKLYVRKSYVHFQLEEYKGALYSVDTAIDVIESGRKVAKFEEVSVPAEYFMLKVNCLKKLERYSDALQVLNSLIADKPLVEASTIPELELEEMSVKLNKLQSKQGSVERIPDENHSYHSYVLNEACKIVNSPVVGRHFVATEAIEEGTVLLEEKPYSIVMESDFLLKKCSTCFRNLGYKFYPCAHCTEIVFCDRNCYEQAYETFHKHECGFICVLKSITSPSFHVFRMISRIGPIEAYKTETSKENYSIESYLAEANQRLRPELNKSQEEKCRAYKMASILWDHNSKHSIYYNVHHTIIGVEIGALLELVHGYVKHLDSSQFLSYIDMLIVDTRRIIFNVFGWHEYNDDWSLRAHIANCQCLVGSLINHSCVPNTNWEFTNGVIRFTTNRAIEAGEEITITYGPNQEIPYYRRQQRLNHYFFVCKCKACYEDAAAGSSLKCRVCSGPVPVDGAANEEPVLNGQCMLCFNKYPDFENSIAKLNKSQRSIELLKKITKMNSRSGKLYHYAIDNVKLFADLFIGPNSRMSRVMLDASDIVRQFQSIPLNERIDIGYFIDKQLQLDLPVRVINPTTIQNLLYWMKVFIEFIVSKGFVTKNDGQSLAQAECKAWNTMFRFHYRLKEVLAEMLQDEGNPLVRDMINNQLANTQNQVEKLKARYGDNLNFV